MTWSAGTLVTGVVWKLDRHGIVPAVPSATHVTSVTHVTAGQWRSAPTLPTPCFATKGRRGEELLAGWIAWARRSRLHEFVALARTIKRFQQLIWNTLHKHGVSNARSEATNTHIRALTKRAYGYHSPEALIAMAMLTRGGLNLELPGRK